MVKIFLPFYLFFLPPLLLFLKLAFLLFFHSDFSTKLSGGFSIYLFLSFVSIFFVFLPLCVHFSFFLFPSFLSFCNVDFSSLSFIFFLSFSSHQTYSPFLLICFLLFYFLSILRLSSVSLFPLHHQSIYLSINC